ncbi:MAG TPA: sulfurtransferase [Candidatus Nitrosotenuis sp.]|nr:sulfurtransferase [Candidatus Nitrosotenuis sp.]
MLITTTDLAKELGDPNLVLVDTRSYKEYSQGHIPGAVNLDLFAFHWFDTSKEGLQSFNEQSKKILSFIGITELTKAVFYDDVSGMLAARGVWLLLYFSHNQVFMLDGGIRKWRAENRPLETKSNGFRPAKFSGKINPDIITGFEHIQENLDRLTIIDARSKEEYEGLVIRAARSGHIPNAINIDWNLNLSSDGTIKDQTALSELYKFPKDAEIVTYCQGAYRAANSFLALKKLGFKNVKVYLGSWGEWGNKPELPVM